MANDVSIAMKVEDNLSQAITGMKNAVTPFRSDLGSLQKELDKLSATKFTMKMDLSQAKSAVKDAKKAFEELESAATDAEKAAAKANWREAEENYERIRSQLDMVSKQARQTEKDMLEATGAISKADNRASKSGASKNQDMLTALGNAGFMKMGGDVAAQWANVLIGSALGQEAGSYFSGALSGAASGAAMGSMILPGVGTVVGALGGGVLGLAGAGAQVYQQKDDSFKQYYQNLFTQASAATDASLLSGGQIAAGREMDTIAFNTLLGEGVGDQYLADLREKAAVTPFEYGDLTNMSRALSAGFKDDPQRMLDLMDSIGNAGSSVGTDTSGMIAMGEALSQMQSSEKTTLEQLKIFQMRGIDVIGMLAEGLDTNKAGVYDMISKSQINGQDAVNIIQAGIDSMYAGAMELQSQTFSGLTSTLDDSKAEVDSAMGSGFNEVRKDGLQSGIDFYGGAVGEEMKKLNEAIGRGRAAMDNLSDSYQQEAMAVMLGGEEMKLDWGENENRLREMTDEFRTAMDEANAAKAANDETAMAESGAKLEALKEEAQALATAQYESSDAFLSMRDIEDAQIAAIRDNTAGLAAATNAYSRQQVFSIGFFGSQGESQPRGRSYWHGADSNAFGLERVPYDNYAALLHEGERVLTASEARAADMNGGSPGITISGNNFSVREEADIDRIALSLAHMIETARMAGAGG